MQQLQQKKNKKKKYNTFSVKKRGYKFVYTERVSKFCISLFRRIYDRSTIG